MALYQSGFERDGLYPGDVISNRIASSFGLRGVLVAVYGPPTMDGFTPAVTLEKCPLDNYCLTKHIFVTGLIVVQPRAIDVSDEPNPTVLIVDDEPSLADGHASQLDDHDVRTAYDGAAALDALSPDVDVVVLDRRMRGLSGDEVLERIRSAGLDCRVIMLTGVEPSVDIVEMAFDEYLQKPVSGDELRETVERVHHRSAYDAKLREYFSLASKRATLETRHSRGELTDEPKYEHLCERLESVRAQLDDALSALPERDGYLVATEEGADGDESTGARADG